MVCARSLEDRLRGPCVSEGYGGFLCTGLTAKVVDYVVGRQYCALGEHGNWFEQLLDPVWAHDAEDGGCRVDYIDCICVSVGGYLFETNMWMARVNSIAGRKCDFHGIVAERE